MSIWLLHFILLLQHSELVIEKFKTGSPLLFEKKGRMEGGGSSDKGWGNEWAQMMHGHGICIQITNSHCRRQSTHCFVFASHMFARLFRKNRWRHDGVEWRHRAIWRSAGERWLELWLPRQLDVLKMNRRARVRRDERKINFKKIRQKIWQFYKQN